MDESGMTPKESQPLLEKEESRQALLKGARDFSKILIEKYPQVNQQGRLNYYICGSLGTMLFLQSDKFQLLDETKIPDIEVIGEEELTPKAKTHLTSFIRKIGDIDVTRTSDYDEALDQANALWPSQPEEYKKERAKILLDLEKVDLSESARGILSDDKGYSVKCDSVRYPSPPERVARVCLEGQDYYIADPKMMLAYKFGDLSSKLYINIGRTKKFVSDFEPMLDGLQEIYLREELIQAAHDGVIRPTFYSPNSAIIPYHNPNFKGKIKQFFEDVLRIDPDYQYLSKLQFGQERSIGILNILNKFNSPEAKQQIIDFINQHREQIDKWETEFEKKPSRSDIMDILIYLREDNIQQELENIDELIKLNADQSILLFDLRKILSSKYASTPEIRNELLTTLIAAMQKLDDNQFMRFSIELQFAVCDSGHYEKDKWVEIDEDKRPFIISEVVDRFGL